MACVGGGDGWERFWIELMLRYAYGIRDTATE